MLNKKKANNIDKSEQWIKIQLKRFEAAFKNVQKDSGFKRHFLKFVFVKSDFFRLFEQFVEQNTDTELAIKVKNILYNRRYNDFVFVFQNDFPDCSVWGSFEDFMVICLNGAHYLDEDIDKNMWLDFWGKGSSGYNNISVNITHFMFEQQEPFCTSHSCSSIVLDESMVDFEEYAIPIETEKLFLEPGKIKECKKCGEQYLICVLDTNQMLAIYKKYYDIVLF